MDHLIHDDEEASTSVQSRKRQKIEDSETQGDHRGEDDDTPELHAIIGQTDEEPSDGHWSSNACRSLLLLFPGSRIGKARRYDGAKRAEGEPDL